jgi:hypothetical protein
MKIDLVGVGDNRIGMSPKPNVENEGHYRKWFHAILAVCSTPLNCFSHLVNRHPVKVVLGKVGPWLAGERVILPTVESDGFPP